MFNPKELCDHLKSGSVVEPEAEVRCLVVTGVFGCHPDFTRLVAVRKDTCQPHKDGGPLASEGQEVDFVGRFGKEQAQSQDGLVTSPRASLPCRLRTSLLRGQFPTGQETDSFPSVVSAQCHLPAHSLRFPRIWMLPASTLGTRLPSCLSWTLRLHSFLTSVTAYCRPGPPAYSWSDHL